MCLPKIVQYLFSKSAKPGSKTAIHGLKSVKVVKRSYFGSNSVNLW